MTHDPSDSAPEAPDAIEPTGAATASANDDANNKPGHEEDASRRDVVLYAFGNVEASIADQFFLVLQNIMVVAMHVNPLLIGLVLGIKTFWDGITDPIMAHLTDNTRSRWGRRRPYILVGGVTRILILVGIIAFIPKGGQLTTNIVMEAQKNVNESVSTAKAAHKNAVTTYEQIDDATGGVHAKMITMVEAIPEECTTLTETINTNLPALEEYLAERQIGADAAQAELEEAQQQYLGKEAEFEKELALAQAQATRAEDKTTQTKSLIENSIEARRQAIAAEYVALQILAKANVLPDPALETPELAQAMADKAFLAAGLETMDIFTIQKGKPPSAWKPKGFYQKIKDGTEAYFAPDNSKQRTLIIYVLIAILLFTTLTTIQSVPYYALGIELCPSYNGRTQVVTYRAVMNQIAGLVQPWIPVFCFSLIFTTALQGLFWVAVLACLVGIPSTVLMCWFIKERTHLEPKKKHKNHPGLFKSMWAIAYNRDFLRIFALYTLVGMTIGVFMQVGFYLNVYWVMGSALSGAKLGAYISMLAWGLGLGLLPVINWGCRKFQKHRIMQFSIIWMAIGAALNWWCLNPEHPEYQFILPFFYSAGIGAVYTVLPTMMADVTDVDELNHGFRREGMFGAVMAFLMKLTGTLTPILAGVILAISGFDAALEYEQTDSTILNLRLMYSFIPAAFLLCSLIVLWRFPLTRERVGDIKEALRVRHEAEDAKVEA